MGRARLQFLTGPCFGSLHPGSGIGNFLRARASATPALARGSASATPARAWDSASATSARTLAASTSAWASADGKRGSSSSSASLLSSYIKVSRTARGLLNTRRLAYLHREAVEFDLSCHNLCRYGGHPATT